MKKYLFPLKFLLFWFFAVSAKQNSQGYWYNHYLTTQEHKEQTLHFLRKIIMALTTLPSGLMYEIITQAPESATAAKTGNVVTVHYTGWLKAENPTSHRSADSFEGLVTKGNKFDSSVDRGQKFSFILGAGQVIKGWDEGVAGMKVGEKRMLVIPPQLGYGNRSIANIIPANSTLIFDVELFDAK